MGSNTNDSALKNSFIAKEISLDSGTHIIAAASRGLLEIQGLTSTMTESAF